MQGKLRFSLVITCCTALGACQGGSTTDTSRSDQENVGDAPAQGKPVLEQDPRFVRTTDEPEPAPTGPTAGTTPNLSPGKNDAPTPAVDVGGYRAPNTQGETAPDNVPLKQPNAVTRKAEGEFKTAKGVNLDGEATLEEFAGGVRVTVNVKDAKPGLHGLHVHQKGDCSDIPGKSMGEHFAPTGGGHGLPGAPERHLGDLGNIQIAQDGTGTLDITIPEATLKNDDRLSLLGRALVIHETEDKGVGKSGGAGDPMACAVIRAD